jgi:NNP family nitrate/nitrite transporter-like MFS transporter
VGTFGSFIGFSAGFPLVIKLLFPDVIPTKYAFLGPLMGALFRVFGGWLSDKVGAAKVTHYTFIFMIVAVCGVIFFMPENGSIGSFIGFFICFLCMFALSGVGNGSTFAQVPLIFNFLHRKWSAGKGEEAIAQAKHDASKEAAAVLGFSGAIGAFGGFLIPKSYGTSIEMTGGVEAAFIGFIIFYATCVIFNWWYYARKNAEVPC